MFPDWINVSFNRLHSIDSSLEVSRNFDSKAINIPGNRAFY